MNDSRFLHHFELKSPKKNSSFDAYSIEFHTTKALTSSLSIASFVAYWKIVN